MRFLLRYDFFFDLAQLFLNALDLTPRGLALLMIQFHGCRARQPPLGAVHDRDHHLQIA
jgi:hypothetical protein